MKSSLKAPLATVSAREKASVIVGVFLSTCLFVAGIAMIASYAPIKETWFWWNLPMWSLPALGVVTVIAGALIFFPAAAFYAALVATLVMLAATFAYARTGQYAIASLPLLLAILGGALMVLRFDAPRAQVAKMRERRVAHT